MSKKDINIEIIPSEEPKENPEKNPSEKPAKKIKEKKTEKKEEEGSEKEHKRFRLDWELEENLIEALDEDAMDLTEASEDESEPIEIEGKSAVTVAQAAQTVFGLFLLIFAVIGVVATVIKAVNLVEAQKDNSAQLEQFEEFIMPLAACDAPTFNGASSLNEDVMLSAACWDIIFHPSAFYEMSGEYYSVSYLDIDRRITKLFGSGLTYSHKTVGGTELEFTYDEDTGMYLIPAFPRIQAYYPDVTSYEEEDGVYTLTVNYRLPITNWIESVDTVEKMMIYTLIPDETDYIVTALDIGEIDVSEAN